MRPARGLAIVACCVVANCGERISPPDRGEHVAVAPNRAKPSCILPGRLASQPPAGDPRPPDTTRFEQLAGSVVHVTGLDVRPGAEVPTDSGTGLVWDVGGHIVTSSHVVERGGRAAVTLQDGGTYPATIVGSDHDRELAVLKIDAPRDKLRPLPLGASNALEIGQSVIAIGNPFGLDTTLTSGTIVALGREASGAGDPSGPICLIQTVAINAGNRGGPLLDASGRVIGVNLEASTGDAGRAVPIDAAREIVARLLH